MILKLFAELTALQKRDVMFTFPPIYSYDHFSYEINADGTVGCRRPLPLPR